MTAKPDVMRHAPAALAAFFLMLGLTSVAAQHAGHGSHGAQPGHGSHGQIQPAAAQSAAAEFAEAEVRRIDRSAGKITLRHGEIRNLDMPPMTMVFEVSDRGLLDIPKVGARVRFKAEKSATGYVVTHIEPVQ
jgi:Cu/Ag efflux protein CusF